MGRITKTTLAFAVAALAGAAPAGAWSWPVDGPVLQAFSLGANPYAGGLHRGVDIAAAAGSVVRAPAAGEISFSGTVPHGGKTLTIRTADGWSVTLVHLGSLGARRGERVDERDPVGTVGPSGDVEHAEPYVHLGVRRTDEEHGYVDPLLLLPERPASAASAEQPKATAPAAAAAVPPSSAAAAPPAATGAPAPPPTAPATAAPTETADGGASPAPVEAAVPVAEREQIGRPAAPAPRTGERASLTRSAVPRRAAASSARGRPAGGGPAVGRRGRAAARAPARPLERSAGERAEATPTLPPVRRARAGAVRGEARTERRSRVEQRPQTRPLAPAARPGAEPGAPAASLEDVRQRAVVPVVAGLAVLVGSAAAAALVAARRRTRVTAGTSLQAVATAPCPLGRAPRRMRPCGRPRLGARASPRVGRRRGTGAYV